MIPIRLAIPVHILLLPICFLFIVKLIKCYIFRKDSKCKGSPEKCGRAYNVKTKFLHREGGRRAKRGAGCVGPGRGAWRAEGTRGGH